MRDSYFTIIAIIFMWEASTSAAVTTTTAKKNTWILDANTFGQPKALPIEDKTLKIKPSESHIRKRVLNANTRDDIGHIKLHITHKNLNETARKYGRKQHTTELQAWLRQQLGRQKSKFVVLTPQTLPWLNMKKIAEKYTQIHHELILHPLPRNKAKNLQQQTRPFFFKKQHKKLRSKLLAKKRISIDQDLLPSFARKSVKHFTIFRGPNCFQASLAFQNERWVKHSHINIRREKNHHKSMINHDELARALKQNFYPVRPPLKYGDLIVFADLPEDFDSGLHYQWIKHAATWLFDGYVFSKGSKSPNSPWAVKTFHEEWERWSKNTKKLGIKAFRRSQEHVKKHVPIDPVDWLY